MLDASEFRATIERMGPRSRKASVRIQKENGLFSVAAMVKGQDKNGDQRIAWLWAITDKRAYDAEVAVVAMKIMLAAFLATPAVEFFGVPDSERDNFQGIRTSLRGRDVV